MKGSLHVIVQRAVEVHGAERIQQMQTFRIMPILFHSDGAEVFKGTEFHMFSRSSALVHKGDVLDHNLFDLLRRGELVGPGHDD